MLLRVASFSGENALCLLAYASPAYSQKHGPSFCLSGYIGRNRTRTGISNGQEATGCITLKRIAQPRSAWSESFWCFRRAGRAPRKNRRWAILFCLFKVMHPVASCWLLDQAVEVQCFRILQVEASLLVRLPIKIDRTVHFSDNVANTPNETPDDDRQKENCERDEECLWMFVKYLFHGYRKNTFPWATIL